MTEQQEHVMNNENCTSLEEIEVLPGQQAHHVDDKHGQDKCDDVCSTGLLDMDEEHGVVTVEDDSLSTSTSLSPQKATGTSSSTTTNENHTEKMNTELSSPSPYDDDGSNKRCPKYKKLLESPQFQKFKIIMTQNWIPDNPSNYPFDLSKSIENSYTLKLLKFWVLTILAFMCGHWMIRDVFHFGYDRTYGIDDFFKYDLQFVSLEAFVYFVVGRLHLKKGVDTLFPFVLPMMVGMVFPSIMTEYFMNYSLSMYDIMCRWPPHVFIFVGVVGLVGLAVVALHLNYMYQKGIFCSRLFELGIIALLFASTPMLDGDNFHPHHWYISWLLGMQANLKKWWSLMTIAFMWGYYINGISSWGRDSLFGCSYSHYLSTRQFCDYMDCQIKIDDFWYVNDDCFFNGCDDDINVIDDQVGTDDGGGGGGSSDSPDGPSDTFGSQYLTYETPNWRTCNADIE